MQDNTMEMPDKIRLYRIGVYDEEMDRVIEGPKGLISIYDLEDIPRNVALLKVREIWESTTDHIPLEDADIVVLRDCYKTLLVTMCPISRSPILLVSNLPDRGKHAYIGINLDTCSIEYLGLKPDTLAEMYILED